MEQNVVMLIKRAVEGHQTLLFEYDGKRRFACAHMLGATKDKGGIIQAFQWQGDTSKGSIPSPQDGEWRFFYLNKMENVSILGGFWYPEPDLSKAETEYKPPKFVTQIFALADRKAR